MPKKWQTNEREAAKKMTPPGELGPGDYGTLPDIKIPHEVVTDAPSPQSTADMASGGLPVVRGNSNQAPLTDKGRADVASTGQALANLGGVDQIISSPAERTTETAAALQNADPKRPPMSTDQGLESHAFGQLEGEPKTPAVRKFLGDMIRKNPDYRIPGQGAMSSRPGESFNDFRVRGLSSIRGIMQNLAENPNQSIAVPKHSQVSKLVKAWIAAGMPDDLSADPGEMTKDHSPQPGEVEKLSPDQDGNWSLEKFDPESEKSLPKGAIYLVEHGETPATSAKSGQISAGQRARAELISAIRSGDWKSAQKVAQKAKGLLSDDEISQSIDEALPGAEEASQLPPHQLLPMASAAGPDKRAELMPVVRQAFGDLSGASPDAAQALRTHIGRLS